MISSLFPEEAHAMIRNFAIAAVTWLVALAAFSRADEVPRPNVLFILADDLGWADITPYGSVFHDTPHLKRLAERAVRFINYYSASPLCSPTRSSLLTGLYPARTGITAPVCHVPQVQLEKRLAPAAPHLRVTNADSVTRLRTEYVTLAELFQAAGYSTHHFGKWHLGHGAGFEPRDQGFDFDVPHTPRAAGPGGGYFAPWKFVADRKFQGADGEHIDAWMANQAARAIAHRDGRPFFINFWMYSVHSPWNGDQTLLERFAKSADPQSAQRNPLYAAMIKRMDDAVGKLLDALEQAQVADNTIVIFTSDNGGWAYPPKATNPPGYEDIPATSNTPLRSGKASNYEGGTRVPCLVRWPGKAHAGVRDQLFSSVDWFPTLLAMTQVQRPDELKIDGLDQTPAILSGKSVRDTVFTHFPHGGENQEQNIPGFWPATWVRHGDWKLIRFYGKNLDQSDQLELYNLRDDVGEIHNLAAERAEHTRELNAKIDAFLQSTGAVVPTPNPRFRRDSKSDQASGWSASRGSTLEIQSGRFSVASTNGDPYIFTRKVPAGDAPYRVEFKLKSNSRGGGQIFWTTNDHANFHRDRSVAFAPQHDNQWADYVVKLPAEQPLTGLRIDPSTAPGDVQFESIRLIDRNGKRLIEWAAPAAKP